jgi:hypothetical protein
MKDTLIISVLFLVSFLFVSSLAVADTTATNEDNANLVIYRPNDGSSLNYRIWVDGEHMGRLKVGATMKLRVDPGNHVISSNDSNRTQLTVTVTELDATYVRKEVNRKNTISLVADNIGYRAFAGL